MSNFRKHKYEINSITGCWNWLLHLNNGYGRIGIEGRRNVKVYAHRFYYEQKFGKIPIGFDIDHLCKNRKCVNPDHMEVVTRKVNLSRKTDSPKLLSNEDKVQIVNLYNSGMSQIAIAAMFGIRQSGVQCIIKYRQK